MNRNRVMSFVLCFPVWLGAQAPETLEPGKPLDRQIKAGEAHTYHVQGSADHYLNAVITTRGPKLKVVFSAPDGKELATADPFLGQGPEEIAWMLPTDGRYQIVVRTAGNDASGAYELALRHLREPAAEDRRRADAFQTFAAAERLAEPATAASLKRTIAKYEQALAGWRALGDVFWQGRTLHQIAHYWERLGELVKARDALLAALPLRRAAGNRRGEANSLNNLGIIYNGLGDPAKALEVLSLALELHRSLNDRQSEAATLNNISVSYGRMGEPSRAVEVLLRALEIRREVGDRLGEAITLNNLGSFYRDMGDMQAALDRYLEALTYRRQVGDRRGEAAALANIGGALAALGEHKRALEYRTQAAAVFEAVGDRRGLATVLSSLGGASSRLGDSAEALRYFGRALTLRREIGDRQGEILTLINMGAAELRMGAHDKSLATEEAALAMARKIGFRNAQAMSLYYAAQTEVKLGESARARDRLIEAVTLFQAEKKPEFESMALASLAGVELTANNLQQALEYSRLAVGISDSIRGKVADPELRASFRASRGGHYRLHVEALMRLHTLTPAGGFDALALETIERSRARSLVEMLGESHIDLRQEIPPEQRRREDQILDRINQAQRELFRAGLPPARKPEVKKELAAAEYDLDTFRLELNKSGSRYAKVQYATALGPDQIRRELLDPDTALIEYALGEQQSYVWVMTREGFISAALPPRPEIEGRVAAYRKELAQGASALTVRTALARLDALGAELYRDLLAPVETAFRKARRLIIVPDGALAYLPFETLGGKTRMIERFAIGYAPSASVLATLRSRSDASSKPSRILLAFGDPVYTARGFDFTRLPNTRAEVTTIRSLYPTDSSRVYLGAEAREENVKGEQLDQYRFIHFAAHGYYDEEQPSRSGIVLSLSGDSRQDGVLQVPEIMRLRLRAEMVSLSACQTGLGKLLPGEGVMGLGRAFLYAGADSLLISLWNVNDTSTAALMKRVYENINRGLPRDEALRQAKLRLLRSQQAAWRHPYYWAPFVLLGNPSDGRLSPR